MKRYIKITKRKKSPQKKKIGNTSKITKPNKRVAILSGNRFKILVDQVAARKVRLNIKEIKCQPQTEDNFHIIEKYLRYANINFNTYQLKSSKGLQVVLKAIKSSFPTQEIADALAEKGFAVKSVVNIPKRIPTTAV